VAEWQTRRTQTNLSARREIGDAELLKIGETLAGNPEPSPAKESSREGVETRRAAPNPRYPGYGEGIVQTPNLDEGVAGRSSERAAKAVEARKSAGRKAVWVRLPPPAPIFNSKFVPAYVWREHSAERACLPSQSRAPHEPLSLLDFLSRGRLLGRGDFA
jgi:hypothetical protein